MDLYLAAFHGDPPKIPLPGGGHIYAPDLIAFFEDLGLPRSSVPAAGPATHLALVVRHGDGLTDVLEAIPPRARMNPWLPIKHATATLWELRLAPGDALAILRQARVLVASDYPYDALELPAQAIALAAEHFGLPDARRLALARFLPDGGVCTRFVLDAFLRSEVDQAVAFADGMPNLAPAQAVLLAQDHMHAHWLHPVNDFESWVE